MCDTEAHYKVPLHVDSSCHRSVDTANAQNWIRYSLSVVTKKCIGLSAAIGVHNIVNQ